MKTLSKDRLLLEPPPLGCVLALPGLPGSGSKSQDRSPYGNTGTLSGTAWTRLASGLWCLSFDDANNYVDCGNGASFNLDTLTILAWIHPLNWGNTSYGRIVSKGSTTAWAFYLVQSYAGLGFVGAGFGGIYSNNAITLGQWQQASVTYDKTNLKFYVNGAYRGGSALTATLATNTSSLLIGAEWEVAFRYFNGYVALVRIFNRALSALELRNSFDQERFLFAVSATGG